MTARPIVIGAPEIRRGPVGADVRYPIEGLPHDELSFRVSPEAVDFVDDASDAAVATLLPLAMLAARPLHVRGWLSERFLWGVRHVVMPVLQRQLPFLAQIPVVASTTRDVPGPTGRAVLCPASGGVDSFSAIQDHLLASELPDGHRVTHLLFAHVGHHGYGEGTDARAEARRGISSAIASELGVPLVGVESNAPVFYPYGDASPFRWLATITVRSAAIPLLLQRGVRWHLCPSSGDFSTMRVLPTGHQASLDPVLLPALGTEAVSLFPVGWDYTRLEKVRRIGGLDVARRHLSVCIMEGRSNCSRCEKCLRTLFALEVTGHLEAFGGRFDLGAYRRRRSAYLARVLVERERASAINLRHEITEHHVSVPLESAVRAQALRAWRVLPQALRRRLRKIPDQRILPSIPEAHG